MSEILTYNHYKPDLFSDVDISDDTKGAKRVLKWAYDHYGKSIVYSCSFGAEGMVLIDLISKVKKDAKIVFLDTDLHFQETYDLIDRVKENYPNLNIQLKKPDLTLEEQASEYEPALWTSDPNQCCYIRKIKPLEEVLSGSLAWVSGLRREQSPTRQKTEFINKDDRFQSIKVCPLIHWTWDDVWTYIKEHDLTYNELHDAQYPSIGCIPCTSQVTTSGDSREGRWTNFGKTECGLHTTSSKSE